jgi:hypothetical protein
MNHINFKQVRDLGGILQDSSSFIKQNFVKIMKPTLLVVSVPLLLGALMMATGYQDLFDQIERTPDPSTVFSFMGGMLGSYLLVMIAFILAYVMFIGYIKLYAEGVEDITLTDLMPILKSKGPSIVLSSIVLFILLYIGLFLCVIPGIYLSVVFAHFFSISIIEETGFGDSWNRSFKLIKGDWWYSFGLYIVTYVIALGVMMLIYVPTYAIMVFEMIDVADQNDPTAMMDSMSNMFSFLLPVYYFAALLISLLFSVVSTMKYYSLVEGKEGTGERELINQL